MAPAAMAQQMTSGVIIRDSARTGTFQYSNTITNTVESQGATNTVSYDFFGGVISESSNSFNGIKTELFTELGSGTFESTEFQTLNLLGVN